MKGYSVSTAVGRVQAGEYDQVWTPRTPRTGKCGLILLHGSGSPASFIDPGAQHSSMILAAALATEGIPCIAGDFGQQTWGDDTVMARIDSAWTVLRAANPTMRTDKVCLLGVSMGGAAIARYSQLYPAKVAAVLGLIPLWDLKAFYASFGAGATQTEIAGAWGVAAGAALPASADVAGNAAKAKGIPTLAGYSSVDTTVLPAWVTAYAGVVGATTMITDSTFGHSDQAVAGMPISTAARFLVANGA